MLTFTQSIKTLFLTGLSTSIFAAPLGLTAFSVVPFTTSTTVQSIGQTSIKYTVTNNASANMTNVSISPNWSSSGVGLSLSNDTCSGHTLSPHSSCTFDVVILGQNQPSSFTIRPKVCGFSGQICSQATSTTSVTVLNRSLPLRAYEVIFSMTAEELVGINIHNTRDIIWASITNPSGSGDGPLVISPDGSRVYMLYKNQINDETYDYKLLVFEVTATGLTQLEGTYSLGTVLIGQMVITPDGHTLYLTNRGYSGSGYPVYRIDLTNPNHASAVTGISDGTTDGLIAAPKGIVVSPDGATVYVGNSASGINKIFSFSNSSTTEQITTVAQTTDLSAISALLISSDGSELYAAGQRASDSVPAIKKYDISDGYSTTTFAPSSGSGSVLSFALSPDNTKIYSIFSAGPALSESLP